MFLKPTGQERRSVVSLKTKEKPDGTVYIEQLIRVEKDFSSLTFTDTKMPVELQPIQKTPRPTP